MDGPPGLSAPESAEAAAAAEMAAADDAAMRAVLAEAEAVARDAAEAADAATARAAEQLVSARQEQEQELAAVLREKEAAEAAGGGGGALWVRSMNDAPSTLWELHPPGRRLRRFALRRQAVRARRLRMNLAANARRAADLEARRVFPATAGWRSAFSGGGVTLGLGDLVHDAFHAGFAVEARAPGRRR